MNQFYARAARRHPRSLEEAFGFGSHNRRIDIERRPINWDLVVGLFCGLVIVVLPYITYKGWI